LKPRFIKQLVVFCFTLVASCFLLEGAIRYFLPQDIIPIIKGPAFGIPTAPLVNLDIDMINQGNFPPYHIFTNHGRIRSRRNFQYSKPPDTYRILCLGDSIFFGYGVNNDELFSSHLEKLLNGSDNLTRYEVINASAGGWGLLEYATFLKNEGYKYSPDLVIFSIHSDDFRQKFVDFISWEGLESFEKTITLKGPEIVLDSSWSIHQTMMKLRQFPFFSEITRYSQLFYLVRKRLQPLVQSSRPSLIDKSKQLDNFLKSIDFKGYDKTIWKFEKFELNLERLENNPIKKNSKNNNEGILKAEANTVLYYFMINYLVNMVRDLEAKPLIVHSPTLMETLKMVASPQIPILKNQIPSVLQLFFLESFIKAQIKLDVPIFFPSDNHWTPAGHRLVAWILYNFLAKNMPNMNLSPKPKILNPFSFDNTVSLKKTNARIAKLLELNPVN